MDCAVASLLETLRRDENKRGLGRGVGGGGGGGVRRWLLEPCDFCDGVTRLHLPKGSAALVKKSGRQ